MKWLVLFLVIPALVALVAVTLVWKKRGGKWWQTQIWGCAPKAFFLSCLAVCDLTFLVFGILTGLFSRPLANQPKTQKVVIESTSSPKKVTGVQVGAMTKSFIPPAPNSTPVPIANSPVENADPANSPVQAWSAVPNTMPTATATPASTPIATAKVPSIPKMTFKSGSRKSSVSSASTSSITAPKFSTQLDLAPGKKYWVVVDSRSFDAHWQKTILRDENGKDFACLTVRSYRTRDRLLSIKIDGQTALELDFRDKRDW